uniref:Uncharacterized protein n=1 Tax=Rhizophora mucronata TaxID=61149 RepID=A0A2P2PKW7_RHIMU
MAEPHWRSSGFRNRYSYFGSMVENWQRTNYPEPEGFGPIEDETGLGIRIMEFGHRP